MTWVGSFFGHAMQSFVSGGGGGDGMAPMNYGIDTPSSSMSSEIEIPYDRTRSAGSGLRGAHTGRYTGEHVSMRDAANGQPIYQGIRGGHHQMTSGGLRHMTPESHHTMFPSDHHQMTSSGGLRHMTPGGGRGQPHR